ncbi:MAG: hypothetical protein HOP09_03690 [Hyphomicrobium sp.]|nr:hypothetical protein [Hyphomicrobium sp.]
MDELLRGFKSGISYRTLEPRIAFDGAAAATAAAVADQQVTEAGPVPEATDPAADAHAEPWHPSF